MYGHTIQPYINRSLMCGIKHISTFPGTGQDMPTAQRWRRFYTTIFYNSTPQLDTRTARASRRVGATCA